VTCDQQYAEPHGGAGFPPSIPRRFVHTKGVSEVKVIPSGKNISALRMDIKDEGGSLHHVELHVPVPNHWPTWLLDGGVIIGNENRQIHWPKELLGEITSVKFDTSDDEMLGTFDKIEIHYNRAYGRIVDSCN